MKPFAELPIRFKLVLLLGVSAALALFISASLVLSLTMSGERHESLRHLRQISDIGGENLRAALAFEDAEGAARILHSLHVNPDLLVAVVYRPDGRRFSAFTPSGGDSGQVAAALALFAGEAAVAQPHEGHAADFMYALTPIVLEGERLGTLGIAAGYDALNVRLADYAAVQIGVTLFTLLLIVPIAFRLQGMFTRPILDMIAAVRGIAETRDYGVRLTARRGDEFSDLYRHFNAMVDEIARRDERLRHLATTDPLTGLANRRQALEALDTLLERSRRRGEPFGLIAFDIDHFKAVNDRHGHAAGDAVLRAVADALRQTVRPYDLAARMGGEEFLVLCEAGDAAATLAVAERVRETIGAVAVPVAPETMVTVTISAGVSIGPGADPAQLLALADAALYRAKDKGRNRVELADAPAGEPGGGRRRAAIAGP